MTISTVHCHVLQGPVTRLIDMEGATTGIICPEYDDASGLCKLRLRELEGGPLARLIAQTSNESLAAHSARCDLL